MGVGLSLCLLGLPAPVRAQESPAGAQSKEQDKQKQDKQKQGDEKEQATSSAPKAGVSAPSTSPASVENLPLLLLVVQRPQGTPARPNDANASLSLMLRSTLRESRRYQVVLYSADHPSIRRALLEHAIAATDLVEPIKPEAMQKLAQILGARYILMVSAALDKVGMKTDTRLMQDMGPDMGQETWITPRSEPIIVDAQFGKLRLKNDQLLALTVDSIDNFLGIPSHLAANIHLGKTKIIGKPVASNAKDKNTKDKSAQNRDGGDAKDDANTGAPGQNDKVASSNSTVAGNGGKPTPGTAPRGSGAYVPAKPTAGNTGRGDNDNGSASAEQDNAPPDKLPFKSTSKPKRNAQVAKNDRQDKNPRVSTTADGVNRQGTENGNAENGTFAQTPATPRTELACHY